MSARTVVVFRGPSISREATLEILPDAVVLGPAAMGDVLSAAVGLQPHAIVLIDGVFGIEMSVFHKELLYALHHGIHVIGASSMGALRAAECNAFGMTGVGEVYQGLACGAIVDDDEVALTHASQEFDHRSLSEAMVTIRATLGAAAAAGLLTPDEHDRLVAAQKARYFPGRSFATVVSDARDLLGHGPDQVEALRAFVRQQRVDPKERDARAALAHAAQLPPGPLPEALRPQLPDSAYFRATSARDVRVVRDGTLGPSRDRIRRLDVLSRPTAAATQEAARTMQVLIRVSHWWQEPLTAQQRDAARTDIATRLGVPVEELEDHAAEWDLDARGLAGMVERRAHVLRVLGSTLASGGDTLLASEYLDVLRLRGEYASVRDSAMFLEGLAESVDIRDGLAPRQLLGYAMAQGIIQSPGDLVELARDFDLGPPAQVLVELDTLARASFALTSEVAGDPLGIGEVEGVDLEPRMTRGSGA